MATPKLDITISGHLIDAGDGENYQFPLNIGIGMEHIDGGTVLECAHCIIAGFALKMSAALMAVVNEQGGGEESLDMPGNRTAAEVRLSLAKSMLMHTLMDDQLFKKVDSSDVSSPLAGLPVAGEGPKMN